jgi:cystathionine gamma-synthase
MGVDVVLHSATKYLGGHNDLMAGVALGSDKLMNDLYKMQRMIGATPGPLTCFLLERGMKTFGMRMEQHNKAVCPSPRCETPKLGWYLPLSLPDHKLATEQMKGFV